MMWLSGSHGRRLGTGSATREQITWFGAALADGDLLVIHAVKLRRGYIDAYVRVMACREE